MVSTWSKRGLYSLDWDSPVDGVSTLGRTGRVEDSDFERLNNLLGEYFQTGQTDFRGVQLDPSGWQPFTQLVYQRCREIKPGETLSYKELARRAGNPAASRAVGAAMARNRILLVIPCHRVVSSTGTLQGFSAPGGLETKRYLLNLES